MQSCAQKPTTTNNNSNSEAAAPTQPNGCLGCDITFEGSATTNNSNNNNDVTNDNINALSPLFFNNLGCIHYKLKKFSASSFYFNRALKESESVYTGGTSEESTRKAPVEEKKLTVDQFSRTHEIEILYNLGLQLLLTGKPDLAFQSFQEVALLNYKSPFVWLRLAESCVAAHVLKVRYFFTSTI